MSTTTGTSSTWAAQMADLYAQAGRDIAESTLPRAVVQVPVDVLRRAMAAADAAGTGCVDLSIPAADLRRVTAGTVCSSREQDPRPMERIIARWWGDLERGEGRPTSVEMERRVARALQRGGASRLGSAETWRRVQVWSAAKSRNRRRPPAKVLRDIIRDDAEAARWEQGASCHG